METDTLTQAIALARSGQTGEARKLLLEILKADPTNETAWMWLVQVLPNNAQRISALEQCLKFNPQSEKARQGLERLRKTEKRPDEEPSQEFGSTSPVQSAQLSPVPRFSSNNTPEKEDLPSQDLKTPQLISDGSRPHSPLILGKPVEEEMPVVKKLTFLDIFRRKAKEPEINELKIQLGISSGLDKNDDQMVARVFTSDIDDVDTKPENQPLIDQLDGKGTDLKTVDPSILDQLRGNAGKRVSSRRTYTTRTMIRSFLLVFYLGAFIAAGYFTWKNYGAGITALVTDKLISKPTVLTDQVIETQTVEANDLTLTSTPAISTAPAPTETPVPIIGERPEAGLGMIVYSTKGLKGNLDIFSMPPQGGEATNLSPNNSGDDRDPALAMDGRLAYSLNGTDLYIIESSGNVERLTSNGAGNREPDWSPDGTQIAFVSELDGNPEIYVINSDGSNAIRLTDQTGIDSSPTWSPDGTQIAFISERDGSPEIYSMSVDGSNVKRLTYDFSTNSSPDWSPDGRWIVFSGDRDGDREIYAITAEGTQQNRLTFSSGVDEQPVWSPDGYWILFTSDREQAGFPNLYAMLMDGSRPFKYFNDPSSEILTPDWSRK